MMILHDYEIEFSTSAHIIEVIESILNGAMRAEMGGCRHCR